MTRILSVVSGKGGVGKTLFTGAFGITLARQGYKVLLIDADMGLRNLDLILGLESDCLYTICDLAEGRCFSEDAILPVMENLDFLAADQRETWDDILPAAIDTVLEDEADRYDFVLLDCPAGIGKGIAYAMSASERAVAIMAPSWASARSTGRVMQMMRQSIPVTMVLNQFVHKDLVGVSFEEAIETVDEDDFGGVIPYSEEAARLSRRGELPHFTEEGCFGQALTLVYKRILKEREYPLSRWQSLLRLGALENESFTTEKENTAKSRWEKVRMNYKWRRGRW
ncbi:MAG: AAA family ATPase [Dialister sp.]|nr:AAA family ATPase [Dialister sp.]